MRSVYKDTGQFASCDAKVVMRLWKMQIAKNNQVYRIYFDGDSYDEPISSYDFNYYKAMSRLAQFYKQIWLVGSGKDGNESNVDCAHFYNERDQWGNKKYEVIFDDSHFMVIYAYKFQRFYGFPMRTMMQPQSDEPTPERALAALVNYYRQKCEAGDYITFADEPAPKIEFDKITGRIKTPVAIARHVDKTAYICG